MSQVSNNFFGRIYYRSSKDIDGPGEKILLALNPQRREAILKTTGWDALEPGTLNLKVAQEVQDALFSYEPVLSEDGETLIYPKPFEGIPKRRRFYVYYPGIARASGKSSDVLVRRAGIALPGRVELFAPLNLTTYFGLHEGDAVEVTITAGPPWQPDR